MAHYNSDKYSDKRVFKIGEVYLMNFSGDGSEQRGWRPGLVFQNNVGNKRSPNIIALPLTSSLKKVYLPTHVLLPASDTGLVKDSVVLCENPERMSKSKVGKFLTSIPEEYMSKIAIANLLASSAISFLPIENLNSILSSVWEKATALNAMA